MSLFTLVPGRAQANPELRSVHHRGVPGQSTVGLSLHDASPSSSNDHTSSSAAP